jgi:hypothetical protein
MATRSRARGPLLLVLAVSAAMATVVPSTANAKEPAFVADRFALRSLDASQLSFSGYHRSPLPPRQHLDADGSPMRRWGDRWVYPTGGLSMLGMSRIVAWQVTGDRRQLDQALTQAATLRRITIRADGAWWLPHDFNYGAEGMRAPWFNAMTQGLALSFFIRLYQVTGDRTHLDAAGAVFRSFEQIGRGHRRWVAYTDGERHLWLEHYPSGRPDHVLNAHLHAIFGLYEYWNETGDPSARHILEGAITTMRDRLDDYRRPGGVSFYCLYHRSTLIHYHAIHVWQIKLLGRISGDAWFLEMSRRFRQDAGFSRPGRGAPGWPHPAVPRTVPDPIARDTPDAPDAWLTMDALSPVFRAVTLRHRPSAVVDGRH